MKSTKFNLRSILLLLNSLLALTTIGAYCAPYLEATDSIVISLLGLTYSGQLLLHFIFIVLWILVYPKYSWISIVFICAELVLFNHVMNFHTKFGELYQEKNITIASFNMQFSKDLVKASHPDLVQFRKFLHANDDIDILCTQECGWRSKNLIEKEMSFPYKYYSDSIFVAIYSKFPIVNSGIMSSGFTSANTCIWVDIYLDDDTIRVYNTHLESNRKDGKIPERVDQDAPEKVNPKAMLGILKFYTNFTAKRSSQATMIRDHLASSPYPSLICTDLNDVPLSRVYHNMSRGLKDTFKERGIGIGATIDNKIPGLRIDYIFTGPEYQVVDHNIIKKTYSDHYLIKANIKY